MEYDYRDKLNYLQNDIKRECPDALKWGVLQDVGEAGSESQPESVSFFHKLLQEFAAAWHICKTVEKALDKKVCCVKK